jgi:hypothetical protein
MEPQEILAVSKKHLNRVTVDVFSPPYVIGGFRSGDFSGTVDGKKIKFYSSISAKLDLNEMKEKLISDLCYQLEIFENKNLHERYQVNLQFV